MKLIDKVLEDKELVKKIIIESFCPHSYFGFEDVNVTNCDNYCEECWNREIEEEE